jgi:hypothetical protein
MARSRSPTHSLTSPVHIPEQRQCNTVEQTILPQLTKGFWQAYWRVLVDIRSKGKNSRADIYEWHANRHELLMSSLIALHEKVRREGLQARRL